MLRVWSGARYNNHRRAVWTACFLPCVWIAFTALFPHISVKLDPGIPRKTTEFHSTPWRYIRCVVELRWTVALVLHGIMTVYQQLCGNPDTASHKFPQLRKETLFLQCVPNSASFICLLYRKQENVGNSPFLLQDSLFHMVLFAATNTLFELIQRFTVVANASSFVEPFHLVTRNCFWVVEVQEWFFAA